MLNIPHVNRTAFNRHFINRAFLEVRFTPIEAENWESLKAKLEKIFISAGLAVVGSSIEANVQMVNPSAKERSGPTASFATRTVGVNAANSDGTLAFEVRADRFIATTQKYESFEKFWNFFSGVAEKISPLLPVRAFNWIGVRKLNSVGIQTTDGTYIGQGCNEVLLGAVAKNFIAPGTLNLAESRYVVSKDDNTCVFHVRSSRQADPNLFNLEIDIDANRYLHDVVNLKNLSEIAEKINDLGYDLFCWITAPDLLAEMRK